MSMDPREARGLAARQFAAEDARWAIDTVLSAHEADDWGAYVGLLMSHHFVRIAYEGASLLRSPNSRVGLPSFAAQLSDQFAAITARARHASKLLDDTGKSYENVLAEFGRSLTRSRKTFLTGVALPLRWLATDLGLYVMDDCVLGASIPTAYRLDIDPSNTGLMSSRDIRDVTAEWGGTMAFLGSADLRPPVKSGSIALPPCEIARRDRRSKRYLGKRYDQAFSEEAKLLLLMIEGDLNLNLTLLPLFAAGYEMPVFRARVTTLYHSLTSIGYLLERHPSVRSGGAQRVRELLEGDAVRRILSRGGKNVRNRCVHYEIQSKDFVPIATLPMFGVIEAVFPGQTWETFNEDVLSVSEELAALLTSWRPT